MLLVGCQFVKTKQYETWQKLRYNWVYIIFNRLALSLGNIESVLWSFEILIKILEQL